jgi:hypothetical protein
MLPRWFLLNQSRQTSLCELSAVPPLNQPDFIWLTLGEMKKAQQEVHPLCERTNSLELSDGLYETINGRIWVPDTNALRQRMCVIAHCEIVGHRRVKATRTAILPKFYWSELQNDAIDFCKNCLHCIGSLDGKVPRPLGQDIHVEE